MRKNKIKNVYADSQTIEGIAELLGIFGDTTRCKIVSILFTGNKTVSEIASELNMTMSAISHSLRILRQGKIVKAIRNGREIEYSLEDEHIFKIFEMAKEHVTE